MDNNIIIGILIYSIVAVVVAIISMIVMRIKFRDVFLGMLFGVVWPFTIVTWIVYLTTDFLYDKFYKIKDN